MMSCCSSASEEDCGMKENLKRDGRIGASLLVGHPPLGVIFVALTVEVFILRGPRANVNANGCRSRIALQKSLSSDP